MVDVLARFIFYIQSIFFRLILSVEFTCSSTQPCRFSSGGWNFCHHPHFDGVTLDLCMPSAPLTTVFTFSYFLFLLHIWSLKLNFNRYKVKVEHIHPRLSLCVQCVRARMRTVLKIAPLWRAVGSYHFRSGWTCTWGRLSLSDESVHHCQLLFCSCSADCVLIEENFSMKCKKHKVSSLKLYLCALWKCMFALIEDLARDHLKT